MSEGSSEKSEAVEAMVRAGIPAHVVQRARDVIATLRYTNQSSNMWQPYASYKMFRKKVKKTCCRLNFFMDLLLYPKISENIVLLKYCFFILHS